MICFRQPSGHFNTNGRKKIILKKKCVLWNVNLKRNSKAGDKFGEAKTAGYYM